MNINIPSVTKCRSFLKTLSGIGGTTTEFLEYTYSVTISIIKFLDRIDPINIDTSSENDDADDKRSVLFILPYFEKVSKEFEKKLKCIFTKRFNDAFDIRFAYKSCKLSSFF